MYLLWYTNIQTCKLTLKCVRAVKSRGLALETLSDAGLQPLTRSFETCSKNRNCLRANSGKDVVINIHVLAPIRTRGV